jgi:receptor protein-tyrosine kinase
MSIVEKALQKAQIKTERAATRDAAAPQELPDLGQAPPPRTSAAPLPETIARRSKPAHGGNVVLDFVQLRQDGRLPPEALTHQTEEEFRRIKWPLLNAIAHREGARPAANNLVLVTSAIPGEGKTFNALNLALSIARDRDLDVLLVDGDVAQPSLTASLGLTGRPGVRTCCATPPWCSPTSSIRPTSRSSKSCPPECARTTLRSSSPARACKLWSTSFARECHLGVVIVDSPPVLATNEAQVMTRYAGQVSWSSAPIRPSSAFSPRPYPSSTNRDP